MPKVTEAYRVARRDEIIDAATRCFAVKGYQRTSMADIIDEAGLSAGAIYGHFAGKKELFAAVAGRVLDSRQSELAAYGADREPLSPGEVMAVFVTGIRREPFSGVIVQLWAEAAVDPEIRELVGGVLGRVREAIRVRVAQWAAAVPGRVEGDPDEWATRVTPVLIGLGPGFMVQRALDPGFDEAAYIAALPEMLPH